MTQLLPRLLCLALPVLSSCSTTLNNLPGVYSLEIQQGNVINQEMIDQLRPNMTQRQVLYIMGSPMLIDVFHKNRWDYLYSEQLEGQPRVQKRISLYFNGDQLVGVQGDFKPSTVPVIAESKETTMDLPKRDLEKTMLEKITSLFDDEPETRPQKKTAKEPVREDKDSTNWLDIFDDNS